MSYLFSDFTDYESIAKESIHSKLLDFDLLQRQNNNNHDMDDCDRMTELSNLSSVNFIGYGARGLLFPSKNAAKEHFKSLSIEESDI